MREKDVLNQVREKQQSRIVSLPSQNFSHAWRLNTLILLNDDCPEIQGLLNSVSMTHKVLFTNVCISYSTDMILDITQKTFKKWGWVG